MNLVWSISDSDTAGGDKHYGEGSVVTTDSETSECLQGNQDIVRLEKEKERRDISLEENSFSWGSLEEINSKTISTIGSVNSDTEERTSVFRQ